MAKITWKTQTEIEAEQSAPKEPTERERIEVLEQAMLDLILGGAENG